MSASGHERTFALQQSTSALPLKADIEQCENDVCDGPCVDGSELARAFFTFATAQTKSRAMSKNWLERLVQFLPHKARWRPISTAPHNRELEVRVNENGNDVTLEFPCLHTNTGAWINVDLGTEIKISPTHWRFWERGEPPLPHRMKINLADRNVLVRRVRRTERITDEE